MKTRRRKNSKRITRRKNKRKFRGGALESMPQLCFGTAQYNVEKMLEQALRIGYRHIDGADAYSSPAYFASFRRVLEKVSSEAEESPIKREELWITWKGEPKSIDEIKKNISDLKCGYIDLYLIHGWRKQWHMMDILKKAKVEGLIRNYGVSNCENMEDIIRLKSEYDIYANQIQARPPSGKIAGRPLMDKTFIEQCNELDIKIMLFATISGYLEGTAYNPEIISEINKYYLQKYIQDKEKGNVLMVSSVSGSSLKTNYDNFETIESGDKLLSDGQMTEIEVELKKSKLQWMGRG
uniref:NADP-dependent oxidoreductase domain-containing protein n=1 Tax=viral metagenome TaxID=1070528 RepID=A0A6C0DV22_9ZZZZ